jgi:pyruvate kinase
MDTDTTDMFNHAVDAAQNSGYISTGDLVVLTAGVPVGLSGTTNMLKVHVVGEKILVS